MNTKLVNRLSTLGLAMLALSGCGSDVDECGVNCDGNSAEIVSTEIISATPSFRRIAFELSPVAAKSSGIEYTLCRFDETQEDDCFELASAQDSTSLVMEKIHGADPRFQVSELFVIARSGSNVARSENEFKLTQDMVNGTIVTLSPDGLLRENSDFGDVIAVTKDGKMLFASVNHHSQRTDSDYYGAVLAFALNDSNEWELLQVIENENTGSDGGSFAENSIAVSDNGSTLVIDIEGHSQGIEIFDLDETSMKWKKTASILPPESDLDFYAERFSLSGDGKVLSLYWYSAGLLSSHKAFKIYERSDDNVWAEAINLVYPAMNQDSVSFDGDMVTSGDGLSVFIRNYSSYLNQGGVIAPEVDDTQVGGNSTDSVYQFSKSETGDWVHSQTFKSFYPNSEESFGLELTTNADASVLAVGAEHQFGLTGGVIAAEDVIDEYASGSSDEVGGVYIYRKNQDTGLFESEALLKHPFPDDDDDFSEYIDMSDAGDVIIIGADREEGAQSGVQFTADSENALDDAGAALVYHWVDGEWRFTASLKEVTPEKDNDFGESVAISGDGKTFFVQSDDDDILSATGQFLGHNGGNITIY